MIDLERVKEATENPNPPDCYATAFYITGGTEQDTLLSAAEIHENLKKCNELTQPIPGCFVHLWNGFISHIAVVENTNPITVTYRNGNGGEVLTNVPISDMLSDYGGLDIGMSYLRRE